MKFGAHVSIAGGLWNAPKNAAKIGCEVLQVFTRSPRGGKAKPITKEAVKKFTAAMKEHAMESAYVHAPYYVNLASGTKRTRNNSVRILRNELKRANKIGCNAMMFHPGSAKDVGQKQGIKYVVDALNRIMDGYTGDCTLLVEIAAGAGEVMGDSFEEVAQFLNKTERGGEIGVCFDTAHAFASGYDLRTPDAVKETLRLFDDIVGHEKLALFHANDSKVGLNERKDRHEHIGKGKIGKEGFRTLVQTDTLQNIDFIIETPNDKQRPKDIELLKSFR